MGVNWMDVSALSFNALLLLERVQLSWFPGWVPERELVVALRAHPAVEWYLRHKCPQLNPWLDGVMAQEEEQARDAREIRAAEETVLQSINDLLVYVVDPEIYDRQPFLGWDSNELRCVADFTGQVVIDVGAGTGRLTMVAAEEADVVYAVEPVENLRRYLREKARARGWTHVFAVDGLITDVPFPDEFADVTIGGHVFGDDMAAEYQEMERVTRAGGQIVLCPGNRDEDNERHQFLVARGFQWSTFEEPEDGPMRKYWKQA